MHLCAVGKLWWPICSDRQRMTERERQRKSMYQMKLIINTNTANRINRHKSIGKVSTTQTHTANKAATNLWPKLSNNFKQLWQQKHTPVSNVNKVKSAIESQVCRLVCWWGEQEGRTQNKLPNIYQATLHSTLATQDQLDALPTYQFAVCEANKTISLLAMKIFANICTVFPLP